MSDNESLMTIHYVDAGSFYSVYGISTMVVLILLMWYFIRTNLESSMPLECRIEGLGGIPIEDPDITRMIPIPDYEPIKLSDGGVSPYKQWGGVYGDVPLYMYDVRDVVYKPEWDHRKAMYIPNMRTVNL